MAIFTDLNSSFQILDFLATHSQLLLRSFKNKARDHNIDIHFKVVINLCIPSTFAGIDISVAEPGDQVDQLVNNFGYKVSGEYRIYCIKDAQGKSSYLNAMSFGVYHNQLATLVSSLGRYDWGGLGERRLWYPG